MLGYRLLRRILRFFVGVFFRQIEVAGLEHVPGEGEAPVIFAGNHPNSLLDPGLIIVTCGRIVHFAAKDVLFKNRIMRWVLGQLGAVPVARKADHAEGGDNSKAFEELGAVLASGRAMGIFPEGLSHGESQLQRFKTGAARIALGLLMERGLRVKIIPCGLNYVRPKRFRSRVLVQYGPPIEIGDEWRERMKQDERAAARALTDEIERGMRALTINAPDWDTLRVLDAVRRLYQPPGITLEQRAELSRRFNEVYLKVRNEAEVRALYERVEAWLDRLGAAGLSERELIRPMGTGEAARRALRHLILAFIWLPLAVPGFILHAPMILLISIAGPRVTPRKDVTATTKLVLGMLLLPPLGIAALLGIYAWFGLWPAALAAALFVLSGIATVKVLERGVKLWKIVTASGRVLALGDEVRALAAERDALAVEVGRAVDRFIPADMERMFPRG